MRQRLFNFGMAAMDALTFAATPFLALILRFDSLIEGDYFNAIVRHLPVIVVVQLAWAYLFLLYRRVWRYAGIHEMTAIIGAIIIGQASLFALAFFNGIMMPRSIFVLCAVLNVLAVGGIRVLVRLASHQVRKVCGLPERLLIYGAGDVGAGIVREIKAHYGAQKKIVGFIDDNPEIMGRILNGIKVLGCKHDLGKIVVQQKIEEIIVAIPSARSILVREVVQICRDTNCRVKIVPAFHEVIDGMVTLRQLRDVNLNDLLRREPVKQNIAQMKRQLSQKRVMVTGAGGSIGSEICRQIARMSPGKLFLLGKSENNIFEIERELLRQYSHLEIVPIIADVRDEKRIRSIFAETRPQVIFHAAAHKHVPLMESQPVEAVQNNVFGTLTIAKAALAVEAECFVMVSTDKAINPTSVMGATKRVAEMIVCAMNGKGATKFSAVRFGNVLGSRGSVVQSFRKQIARGEALTITHPEMRRYFMTIPEASQLVLQAGAMAEGGEVFVLDMGEPIKIVDLACKLIELTGLRPHKDIQIEYTGLRPGEKMFEELLSAEEGSSMTKHEKIYVANLKKVDEEKLYETLSVLKAAEDPEKIVNLLARLVPTYQGSRVRRLRVIEGKEPAPLLEGEAYSGGSVV